MSETKKTILLVDDDPDFRFLHKTQLEAAGFEVVEADGCNAATHLLSEMRPDLALMDLIMEEKDSGFTLCYRVKKMDPSIPVIIVTTANSETGMDFGTDTPEERKWIKADRLLPKPLRFEQLKAAIDALIGD
jgi:CheY-like chemotaxis protein